MSYFRPVGWLGGEQLPFVTRPEWIFMKNPAKQALSVVGLAAHLGRGIGRVATDAVAGSRAGLPRRVEELDADVLSGVMATTVTSVSVLVTTRGRRRGRGWR
jgi:hypothetical protein